MFSTSRGLDSFDQYLQDVEKYPLIQDPAEERALELFLDQAAADGLLPRGSPVRYWSAARAPR